MRRIWRPQASSNVIIAQTARRLMSSSSSDTVTSGADSKILLSYLTRKSGAPTVSTSSLSSYYFSAISGGTATGSSCSAESSSSKNVLSTRPLDCQTTCHVLCILVSDRSLPKQFSLRLLQDVNAGRATKSQTQAVCVDLMQQISYVDEHIHLLIGESGSYASSSSSGTSLTVNATEKESLHTLWMLYSELCGVMAAMVVSQTSSSSSSSEEMGVGDSAVVSEICHWTEEMCRALRKAEGQSLFSAQVALAAALPSLPKADASAASKFRLTVRQVYSKQATPIDILRPSAKVHFVTIVCLPFMVSYVFAAYVVPLYRRTSLSMMVSVLVAVCAVYMLIFQRRAPLPATQQVDVRKSVSMPSNSHMLQRLIADASTQEK